MISPPLNLPLRNYFLASKNFLISVFALEFLIQACVLFVLSVGFQIAQYANYLVVFSMVVVIVILSGRLLGVSDLVDDRGRTDLERGKYLRYGFKNECVTFQSEINRCLKHILL